MHLITWLLVSIAIYVYTLDCAILFQFWGKNKVERKKGESNVFKTESRNFLISIIIIKTKKGSRFDEESLRTHTFRLYIYIYTKFERVCAIKTRFYIYNIQSSTYACMYFTPESALHNNRWLVGWFSVHQMLF